MICFSLFTSYFLISNVPFFTVNEPLNKGWAKFSVEGPDSERFSPWSEYINFI